MNLRQVYVTVALLALITASVAIPGVAKATTLGGTPVMRHFARKGQLHHERLRVTRAPARLVRSAIPARNRAFQYFGGNIRQVERDMYGAAPSARSVTPAWNVRFLTTARRFNVIVSGGGHAAVRIVVDGATSPIKRLPQRWGTYRLRVTLKHPARKVIGVRMEDRDRFMGVASPQPVRSPRARLGSRTIIMGDSYTAGVGADAKFTGLVQRFAGDLGLGDVWASGASGTGYVTTSPEGPVFADRLRRDVLRWHPHTVIFAGGINDAFRSHATGPVEEAAALAVFQRTQAALPDARIIVVGPWDNMAVPAPEYVTVRDAIDAAARQAGLPFIDTTGWISPKRTADYINETGHPSQAGHDYLGDRLATAVRALP